MANEKNLNSQTRQKPGLSLIPIAIGSLWFIWLILVLVQGSNIKLVGSGPYDFEQAARFGDAFGSLSGLMASFAAAGAWYAVYLQKADAESREAGSTREIQLANKRNFEANFFQLLGHLSDIVNNTDIRSFRGAKNDFPPSVGKDAFRRILAALRNTMNWDEIDGDKNEISFRYYQFYYRLQDDLGHYFRVLYNLCNYVDSSVDVDREFYMKLTFAQLSNSELILLAYNCAYGRGKTKFRELIIRYNGLTNIGFDVNHQNEELLIRASYPESVLPAFPLIE